MTILRLEIAEADSERGTHNAGRQAHPKSENKALTRAICLYMSAKLGALHVPGMYHSYHEFRGVSGGEQRSDKLGSTLETEILLAYLEDLAKTGFCQIKYGKSIELANCKERSRASCQIPMTLTVLRQVQ